MAVNTLQDLLPYTTGIGPFIIHHLKIRRDPQLERKSPDHADRETIERPDVQAVQLVQQLSQHAPEVIHAKPGQSDSLAGLPRHIFGRGRGAQMLHDVVKDLTGGLAGEGQRRNPVGRDPPGQQSEVAVGKLKRLAGPG